ncbi:hypothetical protein P7K49_009551 [Saguinus oedipus]|uniref:Uncharacterized protein n=1 Tax=Saguinus oedipus TaxID=9490 RepID=A0ABQ9VKA1_SAGOE|nr:hypothetical protein P7K49_009551 [Saguinus oedipus]
MLGSGGGPGDRQSGRDSGDAASEAEPGAALREDGVVELGCPEEDRTLGPGDLQQPRGRGALRCQPLGRHGDALEARVRSRRHLCTPGTLAGAHLTLTPGVPVQPQPQPSQLSKQEAEAGAGARGPGPGARGPGPGGQGGLECIELSGSPGSSFLFGARRPAVPRSSR